MRYSAVLSKAFGLCLEKPYTMASKKEIKFMTYNVWSREDVAVYKRMQAISRLVCQHSPNVIFFQEITPHILSIFESFAWWKEYHSSPVSSFDQQNGKNFCMMLSKLPLEKFARWRFSSTPTGKSYLEANINPGLGSTSMKPILIGTTQLECPSPPAPMYSRERYTQAKHAVAALSSAENVVFGGDMSWDDNTDLPFPLPAGWVDAWTKLNTAGEYYSWTYDSFWTEKAEEFNGYSTFSTMKKRSDRFVCRLRDYTLKKIDLIGAEAVGIPYATKHEREYYDSALLPRGYCVELKPSCHRGLVLTIVPREL